MALDAESRVCPQKRARKDPPDAMPSKERFYRSGHKALRAMREGRTCADPRVAERYINGARIKKGCRRANSLATPHTFLLSRTTTTSENRSGCFFSQNNGTNSLANSIF